jgi:hypothetical protein
MTPKTSEWPKTNIKAPINGNKNWYFVVHLIPWRKYATGINKIQLEENRSDSLQ